MKNTYMSIVSSSSTAATCGKVPSCQLYVFSSSLRELCQNSLSVN